MTAQFARVFARDRRVPAASAVGVAVVLLAASLAVLVGATPASAASTPLALRVLVIGNGASDPTTLAWEATLSDEGVAYTEVDATTGVDGLVLPSNFPALSSQGTDNFDAVVIADDPNDFAAGQLTQLDAWEAASGIRQVDGYVFPNAALGVSDVSAVALDATTAQLTAAGLAAFPGLAGTLDFSAGTHGYPASVSAGALFTPWIEDSADDVLGGVYQRPDGVSEAALFFNYNTSQSQWLVLGHALIDWVTDDIHVGMFRNYVEMDIDDTFTPDDSWSTSTHSTDYSDADALRMSPTDVIYGAQWSQANDFRLDQLFNGGGSTEYQTDNGGPDPLLGEFQAKDPATGLPYANDFGWISHTYDTPYLDVGCATQNYIEAELNENSTWAAEPAGTTAGTGGLGLAESSDPTVALGTENPSVFVPGNHSGLADLEPGNPATVDPPDLDAETASGGGALGADQYEYAVTDEFTPGGGQSSAYVTDPLSAGPNGKITLSWQAICHASDYLVYREVAGSNDWSLVGTVSTPPSATLPDTSSGNPISTTDVSGGGELEQTFTDTGTAGTQEPTGWTPPSVENAVESPWEQNPYFVPALEAVGITDVGADASKAYPNPPEDEFGIGASYTGTEFPAGATFLDGTAQVVPRHPVNIYYNASTEAQEVDEYNTLYLSTADGGTCVGSSTTTCLTTPASFSDIVSQVVSGMFENMMSNDPEPSYVHQTNMMGQPPAGAATTGTPPNTPDTTGDGLVYSVLNPLLAEYHTYFTASEPYEQLTEEAIGDTLADQAAWANALQAGSVSALESNGVVTIINNGASSIAVPVTVPVGSVGSGLSFAQYAGALSAWQSLAAGASLNIDVPMIAQTINFSAPASGSFGGSAELAANGTTVNFTGVGNCVIDANQAGTTDYSAATEVQQTIVVGAATVTVNVSGSQSYGPSIPSFSYTDTAPVTVSLSGTLSCTTVNGGSPISTELATGSYTIDGGTCTGISLSDPVDYTLSYQGVSDGFVVNSAAQTINFSAPASGSFGGSAELAATGGASGQPVVFSVDSTSG
ncbi:MAG: hypothetical protein ABSG36_15545, partial [Acidimicrobiales bacterium]